MLNGDFTTNIEQVILYLALIERECNWYPYSENKGHLFLKGKPWKKILMYQVKCDMFDTISIGNTKKYQKGNKH